MASECGSGAPPTAQLVDVREDPPRRMSRRALLGRGGGVLGVGALAATGSGLSLRTGDRASPSRPATPAGAVRAASSAPPLYRSAPALVPPRLQVSVPRTPTTAGLLLLTPSLLSANKVQSNVASVAAGKGQEGVLVTDLRGEPVWFQPTTQTATNLQVDLHELTLTPEGTALVTAYRQTRTDTSAIGGSKAGSVFEGVVQEIDLSTGKVVFEWSSLAHVPVGESYVKAAAKGATDYFHINSISLWDASSLLISARHTWAVYCVSRKTGVVLWQLGGKRSSFAMGPGTAFSWQHHARRLGASQQLSLFDDGTNGIAAGGEPRSRAIVVTLDTAAHRATLARAVTHPAGLLAPFEGSVQLLDDGHLFVGWGGEPYSSEFDGQGRLVLDARFPTNDQSYRAFRSPWHAAPATPPAVALEKDGVGGYAVYVSWNGATEVADWQVLSGASPASLAAVATVPRSGFETAITVHPTGSYLAVAGLDATGRRLGQSGVLKA